MIESRQSGTLPGQRTGSSTSSSSILETEGYDAVQLREVARRARTSLATIYKRYATRDELILAALQSWMDENRYSGVNTAVTASPASRSTTA